jgi:hypothetical protein
LALTIPDQTIPVGLNGTPTVSSHPTGTGTGELVAPSTNNLVDVSSLDLDLLNGQTTPFAVQTITVTALILGQPQALTADLSGTLDALSFAQDPNLPAVLTGSATAAGGSGTFTIPGTLDGTVTLTGSLALGGTPITTLSLGSQSLSAPFALAGNWKVTPLGLGQRKVEMDGSTNLTLPLSIVTGLVQTGTLAASVTLNLLSTVSVAVSYHLETITVPEPGSIALLGVGLVALIPVVRRLRKK